ncbi:MAG: hypothetical protein QOJ63_864 [Solirubrobacteraceae bacterium]|jgi:putative SOS response-associated peptidase YedK|nr:hypothetical protein [Solirubrobacteraceae bacterium]
MCGRYTLAAPDPAQLRARFRFDEAVALRRRFNVAPGDDVLAVVDRGDGGPHGAALGPRACLGGRSARARREDARHDAPDCLDPPEQAALF